MAKTDLNILYLFQTIYRKMFPQNITIKKTISSIRNETKHKPKTLQRIKLCMSEILRILSCTRRVIGLVFTSGIQTQTRNQSHDECQNFIELCTLPVIDPAEDREF